MSYTQTHLSAQDYRAGFIRKGTSVHKWAKENGLSPQYVYDIIKNARTGEAADRVRKKMERFLLD